jgi:hypothetical protein
VTRNDEYKVAIGIAMLVGTLLAFLAFTPIDQGQMVATLPFISYYTGADKDAFANAVVAMSQQLGINPQDIMFVMYNESGFSPCIKNKAGSGNCGLIQFSDSTAQGLGTSVAALSQMTAIQQLAYIQKYLQMVINTYGALDSTSEVYSAVFYPASVGAGPDYEYPVNVVTANARYFPNSPSGTKADFIAWIKNNIPASYAGMFTNV